MTIALDSTDHKILELLQENGRMSNAELAAQVHRSESACHRRVRRLEAEGVIEGYVAVLNPAALDRPISFFVEVTLSHHGEESLADFEAAVRDCRDVMACHFMTGDADYLLHVLAASAEDYERIYKAHLSRLPGVGRIRSSLALRRVLKRMAYTAVGTD
jgi:Lrp/AsnC family leucine-responsive transcriptional regulator